MAKALTKRQDSVKIERRAKGFPPLNAPNRKPTLARGATMADASHYTDSMPIFNREHAENMAEKP